MRLDGKVALVTGASRGIGAAIAERLARDGATVSINYFQSEKEAHALVGRIHADKGKAVALKADVGAPGGAKKLVEDTVKELGRLDILVNNAVKLTFGTLDQLADTSLSDQFATNVEGPLNIMRAALGHLPSGGRVINISSLITMAPFPGHLIYGAAKGALDTMTRAWALELGPRGITVNSVSPGPVETDAFRTNAPPEFRELFIKRTPLGRIGKPDDIADAVALLASHDARWITGQVIGVAGGFTP